MKEQHAEQYCVCGHLKSRHFNCRGMCECESAKQGYGAVCQCKRFKKAALAEPRPAEEQPKVQVLERHREIVREIISERTKALEDLSDYEFAMSEADGAAIRVIAKYDQSAEIEELKRACLAESTAQQAKINERDGEISALKDEIERLMAEVAGTIEAAAKIKPEVKTLGDVACLMGFQFSQWVEALERVKTLEDILNTPEFFDFVKAVPLEAAHQITRWERDDSRKKPSDWFWLVGYLAGKALHAHISGNAEKALHHCISTAAACANWHKAVLSSHSLTENQAPEPVRTISEAEYAFLIEEARALATDSRKASLSRGGEYLSSIASLAEAVFYRIKRMVPALLLAFVLCACDKAPLKEEQTNNEKFRVALLFEVDGIKVYRFSDAGRSVYFTDARGAASWADRRQVGKSHVTEYHEVNTER